MPRLSDKTIVLTRSIEGNATWGAHLTELGFKIYSTPTIETVPLELTTEDTRIISNLSGFDWILFTSATAIRYFRKLLDQLEIYWPPAGPRIAAVGPRTAHVLEAAGAHVDFQPSLANSAALGEELASIQGERILLPRSDIAPETLVTQLVHRGAIVNTLSLYTTRSIDTPDRELVQMLRTESVEAIVFASPSAVRGFSLRASGPDILTRATHVPAVAIGPTTQAALQEAGFRHVHPCPTPSIESIVSVLQQVVR